MPPHLVAPRFTYLSLQNGRLTPTVSHLETLLGTKVVKANDCMGPEVEKMAADMEAGTVLLLENTRFYAGETKNDATCTRQSGHCCRRPTWECSGDRSP